MRGLSSAKWAVLITMLLKVGEAHPLTLDQQLKLIVEVYNLAPVLCEVDPKLVDEKKAAVGEVLFSTPVLSGHNDTSCQTCHLEDKALTDGLALAVGVGGHGEGEERLQSDGVVVPRNAFTLFGRAAADYRVFFWDGKVHAVDNQIFSPIGEGRALGFDSPLAVATVLPFLARDEFLGRQFLFESTAHLDLIDSSYYGEKVNAANQVLKGILEDSENDLVKHLLDVIDESGFSPDDITLPFVGNALASFIASIVGDCPLTSWERYLRGELSALSDTEKKGAVVFFGKGRCAACHSGSRFSDFNFHSVGVPQGDFGTHIHGQDIGRAGVTYETPDRFKFRTPPLLLVSKTSPYGHSGAFETLEDVVMFHINPVPFFVENGWSSERERMTYGKILGTRSELLKFIDVSSEEELAVLVAFLRTL